MGDLIEMRDPPATGRAGRWRLGTFSLFAAMVGAHLWFTLGDNLTHPHANHTDVFDQLPWMYRWIDPEAFPNDLVTDYFATYHCPPGMRAGYFVLVAWLGLDVNVASRVTEVMWYTATMGLYLAVVRLALPHRPWAVTVAAVTLALIPYNLTLLFTLSLFSPLIGGLARSAVGGVLLLTLYGLARPNRMAMNLALVVGAAVYPPVFVIAFAVAAFAVATAGSLRAVLAAAVAMLPGAMASAVIVLAWYPLAVDPRFGPLVGMDDISWAPEIAILHFPYGRSFAGAVVVSWLATCWPALVAVAVQAAVYRRGRLLRANLMLLAAGAATTVAAYLFWPRLYEIYRFEAWPRTVVTNVAVAAVIAAFFDALVRRAPRWTATRVAWLAVGAYVAFNAALVEYRIIRARPKEAERASTDGFLNAVVACLADTPKNTVVASIPGEVGDEVPLFARRSFVISPAALCPYHSTFHREATARFLAVRDAIYATDWPTVRRLRTRYGVRFLIVNRARYDPAQFERLAGGAFAQTYLPHLVRPILEQGPERSYVFRHSPPEAVVVEDGTYQLIDLDRLP
jgi:hypothetical protein